VINALKTPTETVIPKKEILPDATKPPNNKIVYHNLGKKFKRKR